MSKILVIEDDQAVRENIIELLTEEGYAAIGAQDGEEGVLLIWKEMPDLIICDILMPKLDGYGVLAKINHDTRLANIPFIFLTARVGRTEMRTGMDLGADDYIPKPFTRNELLQAITTRLGRLRKLESLTEKKLADLRNNITYNLPHELITPLSVVMGFSELLVDRVDHLDRAEIRSLARDIHQSSQRLLRLVENYLLFAELDRLINDPKGDRSKRLTPQRLEVEKLIPELATNFAFAAGREMDLVVKLDPVKLILSENHLSKLIEETLGNAFKYSHAGTTVTIRGEVLLDGRRYQITIIDHGRGMTVEQIRSIDGFMQYDRHIYEQQGLGLGLYLVKQICRLYQGVLRITSNPGVETRVEIEFPVLP